MLTVSIEITSLMVRGSRALGAVIPSKRKNNCVKEEIKLDGAGFFTMFSPAGKNPKRNNSDAKFLSHCAPFPVLTSYPVGVTNKPTTIQPKL